MKIYVQHLLNEPGMKYAEDWFCELYKVMSVLPGFVSLEKTSGVDNGAFNIELAFESAEAFSKWRESPDHDRLVNALDEYRTVAEIKVAVVKDGEEEKTVYGDLEWVTKPVEITASKGPGFR